MYDKPYINIKPNSTSINQHLPLNKQVYKYNINDTCKRSNVSIKDLDRNNDSKLLADTLFDCTKKHLQNIVHLGEDQLHFMHVLLKLKLYEKYKNKRTNF